MIEIALMVGLMILTLITWVRLKSQENKIENMVMNISALDDHNYLWTVYPGKNETAEKYAWRLCRLAMASSLAFKSDRTLLQGVWCLHFVLVPKGTAPVDLLKQLNAISAETRA